MRRRVRRSPFGFALGGVGALLGLSGVYLWLLGGSVPGQRATPEWTLMRGDGAVVHEHDLRGRYALVYFGYTSCPDICPATLGAMTQAVARLGGAERVAPVFITVDPGHDTPAVMGRFAAAFGPALIGLTGTKAQIDQVRREYGISVIRHGGAAGLDHTSVLLLIGPDGRQVAPLPAAEDGAAIARRVKTYLS